VDGSVQPPLIVEDEKDDDYAPADKKKKAVAPTRPKPTPRRSDTTANGRTGLTTSHKGAPGKKRIYQGSKLQRVVEAAKIRAIEVGKPELAAAVHEIWVESLKSAHLSDLLEAILTQTATQAQTNDFQNHVKRAKKRLKDAKEKEKARKNP
ncbi:hypothetical protein LTR53_018634, partial [Teratosphaeriaceae sp. CCFEE 6253]